MSTDKKHAGRREQASGKDLPIGVWNRGAGRGPANPIRVRTKRLDEVDGDKIALAYWLLAKRIVENGSEIDISEEEARQVGSQIDDAPSVVRRSSRRARGGRS